MRYKPGELVEIVCTIAADPRGLEVQQLEQKYIGQVGIVIAYNQRTLIYNVLVGEDEDTLEVYEEEVRLVK